MCDLLSYEQRLALEDAIAASDGASVGTITRDGIEYRVNQAGELIKLETEPVGLCQKTLKPQELFTYTAKGQNGCQCTQDQITL